MEMKTCPKGHFYDGEINATCPECEAEKRRGSWGDMEEIGPTVFGSGIFDDVGPTEPVDQAAVTAPPLYPFRDGGMAMNQRSRGEVENYDSPTMAATPGDVNDFTPVVGWLVCIDGPDKGRDYRIYTGYNRIGRSDRMDICIRGDLKINRENDSRIAYDDEEKIFFFGPWEGGNTVRVNGKALMTSTELHAYDVLTIGSSKLLFIPLCGEKFSWGDNA